MRLVIFVHVRVHPNIFAVVQVGCCQGYHSQCLSKTHWVCNNASVELWWFFVLVKIGYSIDKATVV